MDETTNPPTENTEELNIQAVSSSELLDNVCKNYAQYLEIDATKEKDKFGDSVEDMLTKLDEFCSLVDMIRSDTSLCLNETLPKIQQKCQDMHTVFDKIDNLETFVSIVRENLSSVEEAVVKAEDEMGSFSGLKKMLSSFVSPKRSQTKVSKSVPFQLPEIYKTEDYFPKQTGTPPQTPVDADNAVS